MDTIGNSISINRYNIILLILYGLSSLLGGGIVYLLFYFPWGDFTGYKFIVAAGTGAPVILGIWISFVILTHVFVIDPIRDKYSVTYDGEELRWEVDGSDEAPDVADRVLQDINMDGRQEDQQSVDNGGDSN